MEIIPTTDIVQDLGKIDTELAGLYRRVVGVEDAETSVPFARALLLNLVVLVHGDEEIAEIAGSASEIMGSHPCRVIVADMSGHVHSQAPASITAVCGITDRGDRRLCGEIIEFHPADPSEDLVGMIMPVLAPDVPVFLWIGGRGRCERNILGDILEVADQIIIDSRRYGDLTHELTNVISACINHKSERAVQDLAWISLLEWRELTARHFDPPQTRNYLSRLEKIAVRFTPIKGSAQVPSAPLLFASWLIERAGLKIESLSRKDGGYVINTRQGDHDVSLEITSDDSGFIPGALCSVSIQAENDNSGASFYVQGVSGTQLSVGEKCVGICYPPLIVDLPSQTEAGLVAIALDSRERDWVYEAAVRVMAEILVG